MNAPSLDTSPRLPDSAEAWLARLHAPDCSTQDRAAFEHWHAASPEHARAYAEVERLHASAALLAGDPLLRAAARAAARRGARRRRLAWLVPSAAVAAGALLALGLLQRPRDPAPVAQHFASGTEVLEVALGDGTQLKLDADAALTVRLGTDRREVQLERGRAEFHVAHDARRPFAVQAGTSLVRDLGTVFQVSRASDGVTVGLLEGQVAVSGGQGGQAWSRPLQPAQQLHVDPHGKAGAVAPLDLAAAQGWPAGELVFRERALGDLVEDMNRYASTKLRLGDASLSTIRVSGSFHAGDQEALARALEHGWQLRAVRTDPAIILLLPPHTAGRR
ncbi:FecR family protein [Frateuria defendens]|uniref:FecR family protein n=1 Tax=Frateuria defendens TaxID=2219559 RepID=UPI00066FD105|nr:FecR domain-containing protein [Frateuria defendens]